MTGRGLRVALAGATGALGQEVVAVLGERRFPLAGFVPFATDRSLGREVEIGDEAYPVADDVPPLSGLDLLIVCTPRDAARELIRAALRASLPAIDCSGAMLGEAAVPVAAPELPGASAAVGVPLATVPPGPALGWAHVLSPLRELAGVRRVRAVVLQGVAHAGLGGMDLLSEHTVAALNSQDTDEQELLPGAVAFDAAPQAGAVREDGGGDSIEEIAAAGLRRLLDPELPVVVTAVRVPVFVGDGTLLQIECERPITAEEARERLGKAPGVELWDAERPGPSLRDAAGHDSVQIGRVRQDPTCENGLLVWAAGDSIRLSASAAVRLAELRLALN